jgi:iron only hydrogenase large subunit-like protein
MNDSGVRDVDVVLTTREFGAHGPAGGDRLSRRCPDGKTPIRRMGVGSGAADIFANTGGVMEAALRTAFTRFCHGPPELPFDEPARGRARLRDSTGVKEADVEDSPVACAGVVVPRRRHA